MFLIVIDENMRYSVYEVNVMLCECFGLGYRSLFV